MIQEIITYLIITVAVGIAFYKSYKRLSHYRWKKSEKSNKSKTGCSDCVADCILRNAAPEVKSENTQLCERTIEKIKCS